MSARLDILINAEDRASQEIEGVGDALGGLEQQGKSAGLSLTDLKSGLDLAGAALGLVKDAVKSVIDPTISYAAEVRTLGRTIGSTAEESSKLIQAADDVGISAGTLQTALQAAIKKGVKPSIEGIGELADQYNAIQDPIERTKFLMENFGRSGAALAPLMEQGAAGIAAAGQAAEDAGLVMSQEGVDSARQYEIAMDNLEDSMLAVKLALAEGLIPAITDSMNEITAATGSNQAWSDALAEGIVTQDEAAAAMLRVRSGASSVSEELANLKTKVDDYHQGLVEVDPAVQNLRLANEAAAVATVEYSHQIESQTQWLADQKLALDNSTISTNLLAAGLSGTLTTAQDTYRQALASSLPVMVENNGWLADLITKQAEAELQLEKTTSQFLFQQVASSLDKDAQLELANSLGLIDNESYNAALAMQELTNKYDTNRDGVIDAKEATKQYKDEVIALRDGIASMADRTVNIRVNTVYQDQYLDAYREATGGGRASGGPIVGGTPYTVGERGPEIVLPQSNGYVMNNDMSSRLVGALEKIASSGMTNNYYGVGADMAAGLAQSQAGAF